MDGWEDQGVLEVELMGCKDEIMMMIMMWALKHETHSMKSWYYRTYNRLPPSPFFHPRHPFHDLVPRGSQPMQ